MPRPFRKFDHATSELSPLWRYLAGKYERTSVRSPPCDLSDLCGIMVYELPCSYPISASGPSARHSWIPNLHSHFHLLLYGIFSCSRTPSTVHLMTSLNFSHAHGKFVASEYGNTRTNSTRRGGVKRMMVYHQPHKETPGVKYSAAAVVALVMYVRFPETRVLNQPPPPRQPLTPTQSSTRQGVCTPFALRPPSPATATIYPTLHFIVGNCAAHFVHMHFVIWLLLPLCCYT